MKLLEALALLVALGLFVWWQLRDLRIAKEQTKKQRERERHAAAGTDAQDQLTQKVANPSNDRVTQDARPPQ
jgi:hypothetical protein